MDKSTALAQIAAEAFTDKRARPIWLQIYDRLARAIQGGVLAEGDRLPGEEDLAQAFGVTRLTLRRALDRHQREGRLQARKGVGVFVRALAVRYEVHPHSAHNNPLDGTALQSETLSLGRRPASAAAQETFGLGPQDETIELRQVQSAGQAPVYLAIKEFPPLVLPDFETAYAASGTVLGAYAAHGIDSYTRVETRLTGDMAEGAEAELLRITPGAPVLRSRSWNRDARGRAIEVNRGCWPLFAVEMVFGDN
ncbi:GntR family transcriptional regulator [Marinibacterium sp. SX1]|uniref:GntR family transcriptional regulator n=1 Tax=Marinibacterium sp. SX1 TaxID=3388424 RepID=UPI003D17745A